jgi:carbamoyl-phosphate synthase large subunit
MASTGEVASFGKDIHEAYWAALLSVNGMKLPKKNGGFLLGGDVARKEMVVVAKGLLDLGFNLFTHCEFGQARMVNGLNFRGLEDDKGSL